MICIITTSKRSMAKLLFTDTDSLTYEIETENVYKDFWNDKDTFDNSDYPEKLTILLQYANKKVIRKFKDEACGVPITEFVGLKSKMYSYIKSNEKVERPLRVLKRM